MSDTGEYVVKYDGSTIVTGVIGHDQARDIAQGLNAQYQTDAFRVVEWVA